MTVPDDRNPLARALDDLAGDPAVRAFDIPVEAVRASARRRRARRTGVRSGLAVLVVAALAGGTYAGLPGWGETWRSGHGPVRPGPAGTSSAADWPAQFERCGRSLRDVLPNVGPPMSLTLTGGSSTIAADAVWQATVVADVPTATGDSAVVWGTDLTVLRDGVVVGVQGGPATPDLSLSLKDRLGDGGLLINPLPVSTRATHTLVSCDQYPSGQGSSELAPGTYELVVTQTLSYTATPGVDPPMTDVRSSVASTLTITAPAGDGAAASATSATAQPQLARCGKPVDQALPDTGDLTLAVSDATGSVPADGTWLGMVTATLPAAPDAQGWTWGTDLSLVRDGVVVGVQATGGAPADLAAAAATTRFATSPFPQGGAGASAFLACDGPTVPPGTYDLVVTETVAAQRPDGSRLDARASVRIGVTITEPQHAEAAGATACRASDADLRRLADPQRNPAPVTISAVVPSVLGTGGDAAQPEITVRSTDHALVSSGVPTVVLTRDGAVVGGAGSGGSGTGLGTWVTVGGAGPYASCASQVAGTDVRHLDPGVAALGPGSYELWVVTTAHLASPTAHDVQVVAGPWPVTLSDHAPAPGATSSSG